MKRIIRVILITLAIFVLLILAYYIKSNVLHIDLIDNRHLLFFKKPFETLKQRADRQQLCQDLLRRSLEGEKIGWEGKAIGGKQVYQNGNMFWKGSENIVVDLPRGKAIITIKARGTLARGHYPYMVVELSGKEIASLYVDGPDWKNYIFKVNTTGRKILSVTFTNDLCVPETGEDRNLYLGEVKVL